MEVKQKEISEAEVTKILEFINTNPPAFLNLICRKKRMEVIIDLVRYVVGEDKIDGGIVVFGSVCVIHFHWCKGQNKWFFSHFN